MGKYKLYIYCLLMFAFKNTLFANETASNILCPDSVNQTIVINHVIDHQYENAENVPFKNIILENNVDSIPDWAFAISTLVDVVLDDSTEYIGNNAFFSCKNLERINLNKVVIIGENTFKFTSLKSIQLDSVKHIMDFAFANCNKLQYVLLPSCIETIGDFAFYGDTSLVSCIIPNGVVGRNSFMGCVNLKTIVLKKESNEVDEIGNACFFNCKSLSKVVLPINLTKIPPMAFYGCSSLKTIELPEGLKFIGESAFFGTGIEKILIPKTVEIIETNAFNNCPYLKEVTIKNKDVKIQKLAFDENLEIKF